jgi:hypothetical protein
MAHANRTKKKHKPLRSLLARHKDLLERHKRATAIADGVTIIVLAGAITGGSIALWNHLNAPSLPFTTVVGVNPDPIVIQGCRQMVLPGPWQNPQPPASPLTNAEVNSWEAVHQGVDAAETVVVVILQGRTDQAVTITQPQVLVTGRQAPGKGQEVHLGGCGGGLQYRVFGVNLDQANPAVSLVSGASTPKIPSRGNLVPEAATSGFTVSSSGPEYFVIDATTRRCLCQWVIQLGWSSMGNSGTVTINNNGVPFDTTAVVGQPEHYLFLGKWETP